MKNVFNIMSNWIEVWFFEQNIDNPVEYHQWGLFHILTLVVCVLLIVGFYLIVKFAKNKEKTRNIILYSLIGLLILLEILIRVQYFVRLYYYKDPSVSHMDPFWIIMPKPWCDVACWILIASPFINKKYFYNYVCITALLCSLVFFAYPGVGYNNKYILYGNLYSIVTHAILLVSSVSLVTLKFTEFKYNNIWKLAICYVVNFAYGLIEIYIFKFKGHPDPMYFMPGGDIQTNILNIPYGLYIFLYITLILVFINSFYLVTFISNKKNK